MPKRCGDPSSKKVWDGTVGPESEKSGTQEVMQGSHSAHRRESHSLACSADPLLEILPLQLPGQVESWPHWWFLQSPVASLTLLLGQYPRGGKE